MSPERAAEVKREIENSAEFKAVQREMTEAARQVRKNLNEKRDSNAEFQRRSRMTKEEKGRGAIERLAKGIKTFNDSRTGKDTSYSEAEKKAREIAKRALGQDM